MMQGLFLGLGDPSNFKPTYVAGEFWPLDSLTVRPSSRCGRQTGEHKAEAKASKVYCRSKSSNSTLTKDAQKEEMMPKLKVKQEKTKEKEGHQSLPLQFTVAKLGLLIYSLNGLFS